MPNKRLKARQHLDSTLRHCFLHIDQTNAHRFMMSDNIFFPKTWQLPASFLICSLPAGICISLFCNCSQCSLWSRGNRSWKWIIRKEGYNSEGVSGLKQRSNKSTEKWMALEQLAEIAQPTILHTDEGMGVQATSTTLLRQRWSGSCDMECGF